MSRARPALSLLVAVGLVACNGILGIEAGEPLPEDAADTGTPIDSSVDIGTSIDTSVDTGTPTDTSVDTGAPIDTSVDTGTSSDMGSDGACDFTATYPPAKGCPDHAFACWRPVADHPGAANYTALTLCGDAVVIDKTTGLMWAQAEETGTYDWAAAHGACSTSRRAGFSDWRLPTRIELTSLVDHGKTTQPAIETSAFPSASLGPLWTASIWAPSTNNGWTVGFGHGYTNFAATSIRYGARCVR